MTESPLQERISIYLPNRIGDAILTLPMLAALNRLLVNSHSSGRLRSVRLVVSPLMQPLIQALGWFDVVLPGWSLRLSSGLKPADHAFYLYSSNALWGYRAKKSYGWNSPHKKWVRFDQHLAALKMEHVERSLPTELIAGLRERFTLSDAAIRYFCVPLALGFSPQEILSAFEMRPADWAICLPNVQLPESLQQRLQNSAGYWVLSMEAAYGSGRSNERRWPVAEFISMARWLTAETGKVMVVTGLEQEPVLSNEPGLIDARRQLSVSQLALLLQNAAGFLGNDSGPMHLANWLQVPSVGIYGCTRPEQYGPVFKGITTTLVQPDSAQVKAALTDRQKIAAV